MWLKFTIMMSSSKHEACFYTNSEVLYNFFNYIETETAQHKLKMAQDILAYIFSDYLVILNQFFYVSYMSGIAYHAKEVIGSTVQVKWLKYIENKI